MIQGLATPRFTTTRPAARTLRAGHLRSTSNGDGSFNTATGNSALAFNTDGGYNTASGFTALYSNTTGQWNTASGTKALYFEYHRHPEHGQRRTERSMETPLATPIPPAVTRRFFQHHGHHNTASGLYGLLSEHDRQLQYCQR